MALEWRHDARSPGAERGGGGQGCEVCRKKSWFPRYKLADRSYKILSNWRAFIRLFQKYGRLDIFNLVEKYGDLADLEDAPEYLEDTPGACAYTDFLVLPSVLPAGATPSPSLPCWAFTTSSPRRVPAEQRRTSKVRSNGPTASSTAHSQSSSSTGPSSCSVPPTRTPFASTTRRSTA